MDLWDVIDKGGVIGILVALIIAGARQYLVFGWLYREAVREKDEWKSLALKGTRLLEKVAERRENDPSP
jgi:hypothetical protein